MFYQNTRFSRKRYPHFPSKSDILRQLLQKPTRWLLLLHPDEGFRQRVWEATGHRFRVRFMTEWHELPQAVRMSAPTGIALIDPYYGRLPGTGLAPEAGDLLRMFPSATVVAALGSRPGWYHDVRTLGEWGVAEIIDTSAEDTPAALLQRISGARGRPLRSLLERGVDLPLTQRGRVIVDAAVDTVAIGGGATELARSLRVSSSTLLRRCRQTGLPVPRRLILWMRMLLAGELLDDPGQGVTEVSIACGYSSSDTFRRALTGTAEMEIAELRERGAFRAVAAVFGAELEERQRTLRRRRKKEQKKAAEVGAAAAASEGEAWQS